MKGFRGMRGKAAMRPKMARREEMPMKPMMPMKMAAGGVAKIRLEQDKVGKPKRGGGA